QVEGPVLIVFEQLTVRFDSSELMNANTNRLTVHLLSAPRELIKFPTLAFFGRIHRQHLVYPTTQTSKRRFDVLFAPISDSCAAITINPLTSAISGVGRVTQPYDCVVLFVLTGEKLRQPGRIAQQQDQHARGKWIECSRMADAAFVK